MHEGDSVLMVEGLWALRRELVILLHAPAPQGWIAMAEQERRELTEKLAQIDRLLLDQGVTAGITTQEEHI